MRSLVIKRTAGKAVILVLLLFTLGCNEPTQEEVEQIIATYPTSGKADRLCASLPVPDQFRFVKKGAFANSEVGYIAYHYASDLKAADVSLFYKEVMARDGWKLLSETPETPRERMYLLFQRGGEIVSIERTGYGVYNYIVNCGIKSTKS